MGVNKSHRTRYLCSMSTEHMSLGDAIARTVSAILRERRLDTKTFAARLPYAQSTVYRQLAGTTKISSDDIERLADALGIDVVDLIVRAKALRRDVEGPMAPQEAEARRVMGEKAWAELEATREAHRSQESRKRRKA